MARARNIKPALFSNDLLADNDPLGRLLFIGMWTIADCNGNLEWREKRIKAQILPYDNCDVKKLAINLDQSGFIRFYSDGESLFVNIVNFSKHQNPHKNEREKGSDTPRFVDANRESIDMTALTINPDKSRLKRNDSTSDRADPLILIPDPLILIPDSLPKKKKAFTKPTLNEVQSEFHELGSNTCLDDGERWFDHYSSNGWKVGKNSMKDWKATVRNWHKRNKENKHEKDQRNGLTSGPTITLRDSNF